MALDIKDGRTVVASATEKTGSSQTHQTDNLRYEFRFAPLPGADSQVRNSEVDLKDKYFENITTSLSGKKSINQQKNSKRLVKVKTDYRDVVATNGSC